MKVYLVGGAVRDRLLGLPVQDRDHIVVGATPEEMVARAFVAALDRHQTYGSRYELCGPKVYTLRGIVEYIARELGLRTRIIGLNDALSFLQAATMEFVPGKPFSLDNYRSLQLDSVCTKGFPEVFGLTPTALESVVPGYLVARRY